jgi:hypothetical protein
LFRIDLMNIFLSCFWTLILLLSTSQVARITGMSYCCPAKAVVLKEYMWILASEKSKIIHMGNSLVLMQIDFWHVWLFCQMCQSVTDEILDYFQIFGIINRIPINTFYTYVEYFVNMFIG